MQCHIVRNLGGAYTCKNVHSAYQSYLDEQLGRVYIRHDTRVTFWPLGLPQLNILLCGVSICVYLFIKITLVSMTQYEPSCVPMSKEDKY